ncbi:uncharacterized protein LOC131025609 [Salvia miltiorrhiza]|uniref:uncharacterized protein LOC131025609 n=1 Tax=Salvia miltiorrhiza TaxID=226208 RepID=UPI0025ACF133|nr:uncharacterized protein LOC131025609 [Salvia miltiorrhiza]
MYSVNNIMRTHSLSSSYQLYYLATNLFSRETKCGLATDDDVEALLATADYPMVYVEHYNGPIEEEAYIPTFDFAEPSGHVDEAQCSQYETPYHHTSFHGVQSSPPRQYFTWDGQPLHESAWNQTERLNEVCGRLNDVRTVDEPEHEAEGSVASGDDDDSEEDDEEFDSALEVGTASDASEDLLDDDLIDFTETERAVDASASLVARESDPSRVDDLQKNSFYNSKDDLIIAVGLWNMKRGTETKVVRSDPDDHGRGMWRVHKLKEHSCEGDLRTAKKIKAHSKVVAAFVANRTRDDGEVIKLKSIMAELVRDFGIKIKYDVALRARNLGMEMIYSRVDDSFLLLPRYLYAMKEANPGTLLGLEVDIDCRFKHLFVALAASISPFYFHLRPVIVVDGTHLKGKNSGILFVAVTKDGNEAVFPLAIGVGPIENDESWKWFMSHLRGPCGEPDNLLIIKGYGPGVAELFCQAAYAYEQSDYTRAMSAMAALKPKAYEKLLRVGPEKWARSQCPVSRYSFLTSNAAESFNARLLWARRLPICSMLEAVRLVIEQWFNDRLVAAQESDENLTPEAKQKLSAELVKSRRYIAKRTTERKYRVRASGRHYMVDLQKQSCECNEFNLDQMPCSHAIAAITEANESVEDYVHSYYWNSSLVDTYSRVVNHLPPIENWNIPFQIASQLVLPNLSRRQAGRPKETRVQSAGERPTQNTSTAEASTSSKKRAPKTCGLCGGSGHTRRSCKGTATDV